MLNRIPSLAILTCAVVLSAQTPPDSIQGRVVGVSDGDTITVLQIDAQGHKTPIKIRLDGIDCPEKAQAFGQRAKQYTSNMVFGKEVTVQISGKDRYGRSLGEVFISTTSVNQSLVKDGLAWWYRKYTPEDRELEALETSARSERRGLWQDKQPTPPWEFRHP